MRSLRRPERRSTLNRKFGISACRQAPGEAAYDGLGHPNYFLQPARKGGGPDPRELVRREEEKPNRPEHEGDGADQAGQPEPLAQQVLHLRPGGIHQSVELIVNLIGKPVGPATTLAEDMLPLASEGCTKGWFKPEPELWW